MMFKEDKADNSQKLVEPEPQQMEQQRRYHSKFCLNSVVKLSPI